LNLALRLEPSPNVVLAALELALAAAEVALADADDDDATTELDDMKGR
jgi:hypothetical protein